MFPLPLERSDAEPIIDWGRLLHQAYDEVALDSGIDYAQQPIPKLGQAETEWMATLETD